MLLQQPFCLFDLAWLQRHVKAAYASLPHDMCFTIRLLASAHILKYAELGRSFERCLDAVNHFHALL